MNIVNPFILFLLLLFEAFFLQAQTSITLNPVKDNTLYESTSGDLSNGSGEHLFFGKTGQIQGATRRALLKFDVSGNIPSGSTITGASLRITVNKTIARAENAGLYRVLADWGEGASNDSNNEGNGAAALTNDATWLNTFYPDDIWTNTGGDFSSEVTASISISATGNYTWTSVQLIADVQEMLDSPGSNFGWVILGNESVSKTAKRIASRENITASARPVLSVTYTPPCIDPELPELSVIPSSICEGQTTSLTASGDLHSASAWHVYSGGCGTNFLGSEAGGIFELNPVVTTTYFVRGEGGCVTPDSCAEIEVEVVLYEDPSFSYDSEVYCQSDDNPLPVITGISGGTFKSSPVGLVINSSSGEIDLATSGTNIQYAITYTTPGPQCPDSSGASIRIFDAFDVSSIASICDGDQYIFGTQILAISGIYIETFQSASGCDSTVTLTLSVIQETPYEFNSTICEGDEFNFGPQRLSAQGTYNETFQSSAGCDSLVTLHLAVNPVYIDSIDIAICQGESIVFDTTTLTLAGTYSFNYESGAGCDSMIILSLTVNIVDDPSFSYDSEIYCRSDSNPLPVIMGTDSGTFSSSPAGLTIDSFSGQIDLLSSITDIQYTVTYTTPGDKCPSSSSKVVGIIDLFNESFTTSVCEGNQYVFGTQTLTEEGVYTESFQSISGCDSIVTLTLIVIQETQYSYNTAICEGNNFEFGSQILSAPGTYSETFQSASGCDSAVTLHLTVNPVYNVILVSSICDGSSFGFGTMELTTTGTYSDKFTSNSGCDSTVTINLTVIAEIIDSLDVIICNENSYNFGALSLTASGIYTETFTHSNGCDSTVILTLHVSYIDTTLFFDGIIMKSNNAQAAYQWIDCGNEYLPMMGETGNSFTPSISGNYALIITKEGCSDTTSCRLVTIVGLDNNNISYGIMVYPNPADNHITFDLNKSFPFIIVHVTDAYGRHIFEQSYIDSQFIYLDCSTFKRGVYLIGINFSGAASWVKIIIE